MLEVGWVAALTQPLGWLVYALAVATGLGVARWLRNPLWPALLPGLGTIPLGAVLMRSALLAWKRGGVMWRGTFYPTSVVRAGQRMK
jgi:hypothetical protein